MRSRSKSRPTTGNRANFRLGADRSYAKFVFHSIWRHKLQFLLVWAGIIGFSAGLLFVLPRTYQVKTTLQAQRNQVMASLSNPAAPSPSTRTLPRGWPLKPCSATTTCSR